MRHDTMAVGRDFHPRCHRDILHLRSAFQSGYLNRREVQLSLAGQALSLIYTRHPQHFTKNPGKYRYHPGPEVANRAASQFTMLDFELSDPRKQAPHQFIPLMATYWGGLDNIHPFREGNTRSQTILFHQVCRKYGYELDGQELFNRREEFVGARFHGHATRGYARLIALLLDTVHKRESEQLSEREQQWAQSLRETSERPAGPGGLHL